jgi:prophage regulatory protein
VLSATPHINPSLSLPAPDQLIDIRSVCRIVGAQRSWVLDKTAAKEFPQPIRIGTRYTRWRANDVYLWAADPAGWVASNTGVAK